MSEAGSSNRLPIKVALVAQPFNTMPFDKVAREVLRRSTCCVQGLVLRTSNSDLTISDTSQLTIKLLKYVDTAFIQQNNKLNFSVCRRRPPHVSNIYFGQNMTPEYDDQLQQRRKQIPSCHATWRHKTSRRQGAYVIRIIPLVPVAANEERLEND